ncbi:MAG: hypothetical protein QOD77_104 [Thermoplasmata archaeon]|jgi:hypothetical protein|nr:hypothetical protein [Thermoplasmata archaeon]
MVALRPVAVLAAALLLAFAGSVLATTSSSPSHTSTATPTPTTTTRAPPFTADPYAPPEPAAAFLSPALSKAGGRVAQVAADGAIVVVAYATNSSAPLRVELYVRTSAWRLADAVDIPHNATYVGDMAAVDLRDGRLLVGFSGPGTPGRADLYDLRAGTLDHVASLAVPSHSSSYGWAVALGDGWAAVAEPEAMEGAVHVFEEGPAGWAWARSFMAPADAPAFGTALAANEDTLFAHVSVATGIQAFDPRAGEPLQHFLPPPGARSFAWPLDASSRHLVVGGSGEDESPMTYHYVLDGKGAWTLEGTVARAEAGAITSVAADADGSSLAVAVAPGWLHVESPPEGFRKWDLSILDPANGLLSFQVARGSGTLVAAGATSDERLPIYIWDLDARMPTTCDAPGPSPTMASTPTTSGWTTTRTMTTTTGASTPPACSIAPVAAVPGPCGLAEEAVADADWNHTHARTHPVTLDLPCAVEALPLPTPIDGRATPLRPLRVSLPEKVVLRYHVEAAATIVAEATVALDPSALPVPVLPLEDATKYLHVEPDATSAVPEAVTIEMGLEGLPADAAATMGIHFWDGEAWVDLAADEDGIVPATTPEGELRVLEAGRDLGRGIAWVKVSHTSSYALAPSAGPAGDLKVEHKATDWTYGWILGGVGVVVVAAVLTVAVVSIRRRFA